MAVRLTENPLRIGFTITEGSANTFATVAINLPTVPSIAVARGSAKALGIEVMKVRADITFPDPEANQTNSVTVSILKGPTPTANLTVEDQRAIYADVVTHDDLTTTSGSSFVSQRITTEDLTDGDGNGEIVADNEIHASILGTGNAAAKRFRGYLLYHLVELDETEALFELIETAQ